MNARKITGLDLTASEQGHAREALRFLKAKVGTWERLSKVLHYDPSTLVHVSRFRRVVTPTLAFRIARLARVRVDDVLTGRFPPSGACPKCGVCKEVTR